MNKLRSHRIWISTQSTLKGVFDRRTVGGIALGMGIMASTLVVAQTQETDGGFFRAITSVDATSDTEQRLQAYRETTGSNCHPPENNEFAKAIKGAILIHTTAAVVSADTESLFDVNGDCFQGILDLVDLSFSIPSLQSIINAAQKAVIAYAKKKVCTAVHKVTGAITTPINQAITKINSLATQLSDLNGMANWATGELLSGIDPLLGEEFLKKPPYPDYDIKPNPFNFSQTIFEPLDDKNGGQNTGGSSGGTVSSRDNPPPFRPGTRYEYSDGVGWLAQSEDPRVAAQQIERLQDIQGKLSDLGSRHVQAQIERDAAWGAYESCAQQNGPAGCGDSYAEVNRAAGVSNDLRDLENTYRNQIYGITGSTEPIALPQTTPAAQTQDQPSSSSNDGGFFSGLTRLFQ